MFLELLLYCIHPFNWLYNILSHLTIDKLSEIYYLQTDITHELLKASAYGTCSFLIPNSFNMAYVETFNWLLSIPLMEAEPDQGSYKWSVSLPARRMKCQLFPLLPEKQSVATLPALLDSSLALQRKGGHQAKWNFSAI